MLFDYLAHIVIGILDLNSYVLFSVFVIEFLGGLDKICLTRFKKLSAVIANNIGHLCFFYIARDIAKMVEALVSLGKLGDIKHGKHRIELHCHSNGVLHLMLCGAGVYGHSVYGNAYGCGIEILVFEISERGTVHGIGIVRTKARNVEFIGASAYLLVWSEADAYIPVLCPAVYQHFNCRHYLGNTRLIVSAEKGGSVGYDKMLKIIS